MSAGQQFLPLDDASAQRLATSPELGLPKPLPVEAAAPDEDGGSTLFEVRFAVERPQHAGEIIALVELEGYCWRLYRGTPGNLKPIGPRVDYEAAHRLAERVLSGDSQAIAWPPALLALASALIGLTAGPHHGNLTAVAVPAETAASMVAP
jgi:hypothetical protein